VISPTSSTHDGRLRSDVQNDIQRQSASIACVVRELNDDAHRLERSQAEERPPTSAHGPANQRSQKSHHLVDLRLCVSAKRQLLPRPSPPPLHHRHHLRSSIGCLHRGSSPLTSPPIPVISALNSRSSSLDGLLPPLCCAALPSLSRLARRVFSLLPSGRPSRFIHRRWCLLHSLVDSIS
jgi:hypothetical protein